MRITQIVHLTWVDSTTQDGWQETKEVDSTFDEVHSIGFLLDSDAEKYVLAHSYDAATDSVNGVIQIPTSCISKVEILHCLNLTK